MAESVLITGVMDEIWPFVFSLTGDTSMAGENGDRDPDTDFEGCGFIMLGFTTGSVQIVCILGLAVSLCVVSLEFAAAPVE